VGLPGTINTFGFGYNLDSRLLVEMSSAGSGSYSFIPDAGFGGTCFVSTLSQLLVTMGREVYLQGDKRFCDDTAVGKKRAMEEANEKIDVLKADIEKYSSDVERLTKEIAGHDEDLAAWTGDEDYPESLDALKRAIAVMMKQAHTRKQASMAQLSAVGKLTLIPDHAKKVIDAFLQQDPDEGLAGSAPEAAGFEFQSQGVIEMMEKLLDVLHASIDESWHQVSRC